MRLLLETVRLVRGLALDLATALVVELLTRLSEGADALIDLLEKDDEDLEPAHELLTYLQQILMAGAQVHFDRALAQPWSLLLGTQEIASAVSLVDLVLQARARAHTGGSR